MRMAFWARLAFWRKAPGPLHLERGSRGEAAALDHLKRKGLTFLAANFRGRRGEIDLIFRDGPCLVFVEVKTRSNSGWTRPSRAVDLRKRRALFRTAEDYLRLLGNPDVAWRFDVMEVLIDGESINEIRHLENCFNRSMLRPRRTSR
jgi:putative endonuclease